MIFHRLKIILGTILFFLCTSGLYAQNQYKGRMVHLLTYNVGAFSKELEDSSPQIAKVIKELGIETVGFNEVDSCNARHNIDQLANLASLLGPKWNHRYASAMSWAGGAYGNGIATTKEIISSGSITLPKLGGSEQRSCAYVETEDYVFASLHLDYVSEEVGTAQLKVATEALKSLFAKKGKPVFLAGDFNAQPGSAVLAEAWKDWIPLTSPDMSYPADKPRICIDYILVLKGSGPVEVVEGCALQWEGVHLLSDHLPVLLRVKL